MKVLLGSYSKQREGQLIAVIENELVGGTAAPLGNHRMNPMRPQNRLLNLVLLRCLQAVMTPRRKAAGVDGERSDIAVFAEPSTLEPV